MKAEGRRIEIRGTVQGVGMRPWIYRLAHAEGIGGLVCNEAEGVVVEAYGSGDALDRFLDRLGDSPPPAARIRALDWQPIPARAARRFVIGGRRAAASPPRVSIPADLATCPSCLAEIDDPANRRYGYAFTNCTDCGPRFTITRDMPYDRPGTTMASFTMCPECRSEYEDPGNRRFHAQPNACPDCGPRLQALSSTGAELGAPDPLQAAARALAAGLIVAIKGIGGFHLACDATCDAAVQRLRARKHREAKPLAVMVRNLAAAERFAELDDAERALLTSSERPIALVRRRTTRDEAASLAAAVAPGNPFIGILLPYTPLHHLLLAAVDFPLVMTSGNLSDEPIAFRNDEALARLGDLADLFLVHDREIESRCDDSVARSIAGRPLLLRRARGYVPRPLPLRRALAAPLLGCGGELKNAFCLAAGDSAVLGPHIGDLDNLEAFTAYEEAIERMQRFLQVRPEVVAHDMHPGYASTAYARSLALPAVAVQHHHAHVVSVLAEHGVDGPVIGVAYDGTGYGTDDTMWGGEILLADASQFERLATFRSISLPGGDRAIRQVWRQALAWLVDAFNGEPPLAEIPVFSTVAEEELRVVRQMIDGGVNAPRARGVGRYFDAVGALVLGAGAARFEGEVAMALNWIADAGETSHYAFSIDHTPAVAEIDLRETARQIVRDLRDAVPAPPIAARFHNTVAAATREVLRDARRRVGRLPIALSGGCFQNDLLVQKLLASEDGVLLPRWIPPGDGGIALGQVLIADAALRAGTVTAPGGGSCV